MRTAEEIVKHYASVQENDILGFEGQVLVHYLTFEQAQPFLKEGVTSEQWGAPAPLTQEQVLSEMREYMAFAWDKARDHRGISASRSVEKRGAWLWILGDDEMAEMCQDDNSYAMYGAPILKAISEKYGFPIPEGDDLARMARGLPCEPGCEAGCIG